MRLDICVGGAGGQGVLLFSTVILQAAVQEGKRAMCLPSYGAEARGGEVSCFLIFSDLPILSPFAEKVDSLVFFNSGSFLRFREHLRPGVLLLHNADEGPQEALPAGLRAMAVPLAELVAGLDRRCENMAMLGVFVQLAGILDFEQLSATFRRAYRGRGEAFLEPNLRAIEAGRQWAMARGPVEVSRG
jgi:Pyruvate/2-oxoacid:ferredoxin oxidoreductase gamma subunit